MKYSGHRKLLCEFSKLSKLNAFILLGYQTNTDASILVYKFRLKRTGFNMNAEYTRPQLTFLALVPWLKVDILYCDLSATETMEKMNIHFLNQERKIYSSLLIR